MDDEKPVLTMVKLRIIGEVPEDLAPESTALLKTLSMLCSFNSSQDLASFLHSPMFASLARGGEPWVVFEIGVYLDHTKTIEFIPSKDEMLFADVQGTGAFENHIHRCQLESSTDGVLQHWYEHVFSPEGRFT